MTVVVKEVAGPDTWPLRRRVLRSEHPHHTERFPEDEDPGTLHLAAFDGDADHGIVGVATFFPSDGPRWQLRGMAVDPAWQGSGVGRALMDAAVDRLRAAGVASVWANVRDSAIPFYERVGWRVVGDGFINELGIPHHVAEMHL